MGQNPLPVPRSREDEYLFDIAMSLRQLTGRNVYEIEQHIHAPEQVRLQEPEPSAGAPTIVNVGPAKKGGWYELTDGAGNVLEKVRGKGKAERRAAELAQERAS